MAAGDYAAGPNHVLPTGGGARVTVGCRVETFLRSTTVQRLSSEALDDIGDTVETLARARGWTPTPKRGRQAPRAESDVETTSHFGRETEGASVQVTTAVGRC